MSDAHLFTIPQSGATAVTLQAKQSPVRLEFADVDNGTLLVEVSNDEFVGDTRRVAYVAAPAGGPSTQVAIRHLLLKLEKVRLTTTGASCKAHLRTEIPTVEV